MKISIQDKKAVITTTLRILVCVMMSHPRQKRQVTKTLPGPAPDLSNTEFTAMLQLKMKLSFAILLLLWSFTAFSQSGQPVLQAGTANISGTVTIPKTLKKDSIWLFLKIPQPFTGEFKTYKTLLDHNGRFALKVNTETNPSRCAISTDIDLENMITVLLKNGQENKMTFNYSDSGVINSLNVSDTHGFTEEDLLQGQRKFSEMITYRLGRPFEPLYNKEFNAYIDHTNNVLQLKKAALRQPPVLSEKMNEIIFSDYALASYGFQVFDYRSEMVLNYRKANNKMPDSAEIKQLTRKDFSFLKDLHLNNPLYLYCYAYPSFTQELLQSSALNIPRIQDTPIPAWTKKVKEILAPLIGSDQGVYYDMLIGNAYAIQFEGELKPLTLKQIENIKNYYKGGHLEKILLRRNQEIAQQVLSREALVVNKTPGVPPEELMSAIISKYKGKTVVVDFWATWCAPCLEAFKDSRDSKKHLANKDVVFVYITSPSSPQKLWQRLIQGIGGQQYYLTTDEWKYLLNSYKFSGIPTYLIFDKKGVLKQQFTGYPGNEEMQKRIEAAMN